MLLRLTERCRVPVHLDSVAGGVQTGHKISAVYFVGRCASDGTANNATKTQQQVSEEDGLSAASGAGGQLKLQNVEAAAPLAEGSVDSNGGSTGGGCGGGDGVGSPVAATPQDGANKDNRHEHGNSSGTSVKSSGLCPPAPRQGAVLEPTADRLVLFRSDRVSTETLEVLGHGQEQYAVLFWMHGAKEEIGEAVGGAATSPAS